MPLTFYVDRQAWHAHHRRVVADRPTPVPVVKGNGYGFTLPVLAEAARQLGPAAGVDRIAVGTAQEAAAILEHFPHDMALLEPFLPGTDWVDLPERVVRNAASVDAARLLAGRRMVIDCRSSLRRQGVARTELRALRQVLCSEDAEGFSVHLPIERPAHADPVREVSDWIFALRDAGLTIPVMYVSHLHRAELDALRLLFPAHPLPAAHRHGSVARRPVGDRGAGDGARRAPVARGERIGYRQWRARQGGWVVVVSGGAVHGVGLEAPKILRGLLPRAKEIGRSGLRAANRTLSPFKWRGRRCWFAEPPHMSVSMIYLPDTEVPPRPGSELVAELRHTATRFDRVAMLNEEVVVDGAEDSPEAAAAAYAPRCCRVGRSRHDRRQARRVRRIRLVRVVVLVDQAEAVHVLGPVQHAARRVVHPAHPHRIAARIDHVPDHLDREEDRARQVDRYGQVVRGLRQTAQRVVQRDQVEPDRAVVDDLAHLPDDEIAPARPGEHGQRDQPQHVLRRVDLVEQDERAGHQEDDLPHPRPEPGQPGQQADARRRTARAAPRSPRTRPRSSGSGAAGCTPGTARTSPSRRRGSR